MIIKPFFWNNAAFQSHGKMNLRINFCEHPSWKRPTFNSLVNHNYSKGCFPFLFKRRVTWQINWHTKCYENQQTHYRKEFNSREIGLAHQHGRRFIVLEHQYGCHDVMWKRFIGSRHVRQIPPPPTPRLHKFHATLRQYNCYRRPGERCCNLCCVSVKFLAHSSASSKCCRSLMAAMSLRKSLDFNELKSLNSLTKWTTEHSGKTEPQPRFQGISLPALRETPGTSISLSDDFLEIYPTILPQNFRNIVCFWLNFQAK